MSYFCKPKFVSQKIVGEKLFVYAPFNSDAITQYKTKGGKWNSSVNAWEFNAVDKDKIDELLDKIFGENGSEKEVEYVSLKLKGERICGGYKDFILAGRKIIERKARDTEILLDKNVVLLSGKYYSSGGSVKNPRIDGDKVVILLRYFPKKLIDSISDKYSQLEYEIDLEDSKKIADSLNKVDEKPLNIENSSDNYEEKYNKLLAEHNALIKKMADLKSLINNI